MRVNRVTLNNFRQFFGEQTLQLSADPERNITLVRAENGVGKTTLLNAILWCLFEQHTKRFEQPDSILSYAAQEQRGKRAGVKVDFDYGGLNFEAERLFFQDETLGKRTQFRVRKNIGTKLTLLEYPELLVKQALPSTMAPYFFFDGEHAENFGAAAGRADVRRAISTVFGCDLIDGAVADLDALAKKAASELASAGAGARSNIEEQYDNLQTEIERAKESERTSRERVTAISDSLQTLQARLRDYDRQLGEIRALEHLETRRRDLRKDLTELRERLSRQVLERSDWLKESATVLVRVSLDEALRPILTPEKVESPRFEVSEKLIAALRHAQECLCGRGIEEGSPEMEAIRLLLPSAVNYTFEKRVETLRTAAQGAADARKKARTKLALLEQDEAWMTKALGEKEAALADVESQLSKIEQAQVRMMQTERRQVEDELSRLNQTLGAERLKVQASEKKRKDKEAERAGLSPSSVRLSDRGCSGTSICAPRICWKSRRNATFQMLGGRFRRR